MREPEKWNIGQRVYYHGSLRSSYGGTVTAIRSQLRSSTLCDNNNNYYYNDAGYYLSLIIYNLSRLFSSLGCADFSIINADTVADLPKSLSFG